MKRFSFYHVAALVAAVLCAWQAAGAQPLAECVPDDAVYYVGWAGTNALGDQYNQSHLKAVVEACNLPDYLDRVFTAQTQSGKLPANQAQELRRGMADLMVILQCPTAIYVVEPPTAPDKPVASPRVVWLIDAGVHADELYTHFESDLLQAPPGDQAGRPGIFREGGVLAVAFNFPRGERPVLQPAAGRSLDGHKEFAQHVARLAYHPAAVFYMDTPRLVNWMVAGIGQDADEPITAENMAKVKTALHEAGVDDLGPVAWAGWFDGPNWASAAEVDCPAPRRGIGMLLAGQPLDKQTLALASAGAVFAKAGSLDLAALWQEVRRIVTAVEPEADAKITQGMQIARQETGVDLEAELIDPLGHDWMLAGNDPPSGNPMAMMTGSGLVLMHRPADAAKLEATLNQLEQWANAKMAAMAQNSPQMPRLSIQQIKQGDSVLHVLAVPPYLSLGWTVQKGVWYFGGMPQAGYLAQSRTAAPQAPALPQDAHFQQEVGRFGDHPWSGVEYADLPRTALNMYIQYQGLLGLIGPGLASNGVPLPALPAWDKLQSHFGPATAVSWSDEHTIHWRSQAPFPGATLFGPGGMMNAGSAGVAAGIMLPALGAARRTANRMKSGTQVRSIISGSVLYAQVHNGRFPDAVGPLLEGGYVTADILISPLDSQLLPPGMQRWPMDQQVAWVNANTSYVLLPGQRETSDGTQISAFEKLHHPNMQTIAVGYADNHVEALPVEEADKLIQAQTGKSLEEWSQGR